MTMRLSLCLLFFFCAVCIKAQNMLEVDSLQKVVLSTKNDTLKLNALIDLCWVYRNSNIDSALKYNDEAYALAERLGLKNEIVKIIQFKGVIYRNLGEYPKALEYYFNVLKAYEELDDSEGIGFAFQAIGDIYRYLNNTELCKEYSLKGLKYLAEKNNFSGVAYCYYSLGSALMEEGDYEMALEYLTECLKIREVLNNKRGIATAKSGIGRVYFLQKKYDQSLDFFNQTLAIFYSLSDFMGASRTLSYRSMVYLAMSDYHNAIKDITQSIDFAKKIGNKPVLRDNYEALTKCYVSLNDYKKAYQNYQIFILYKDSVANEDKRFEVSMLEMKSEQQKLEKESIRKEMHFQKTESRQKMVISISTTALILLLIIVFLLIRTNRHKVRTNNLLELQKAEIEKQSNALQLQNKKVADAYDELNLSNQKLQVIIDSPTVGIAIADLKGVFSFCNDLFVEMFGYSREEVLRMNFIDFIPFEERKRVILKFRSIISENDYKISLEIKFQRKDRSLFWGKYTGAAIKDDKGNAKMIVGIVTNIDSLKQSEEKLKQAYRNVQILSEIGRKITSNLSIEKIISTVYEQINTLMDATFFAIGIYNKTTRCIDFQGAMVKGENLDFFSRSLDANKPAVICFNQQREIIINSKDELFKLLQAEEKNVVITGETLSSLIFLPLTIVDKQLGVITVQSFTDNAYSQKEIDFLRNIAIYTSIALENASIYQDLIEQKQEIKMQAEELQKINVELSKLSIVASKTDNVIVICDSLGNLEWANAAYERVYGHSLDYYIEHHEKNIFKMLRSGLLIDIDEKIKNKEIISYKFKPFSNKDIWMQGNLTPIYDENGDVSKYIIIDIDISNIVRAEATILEQNEKILQQNEELRAQAEQLHLTNEKLIEIDNFKQDLTSMIVHDLKTPLSMIMNTSDIKCSKLAGKQMLNLVMNILDVQKYEVTKMQVACKSLLAKQVADKAIEQVLFLANEKCITIHNSIPENIGVLADDEIVERVFENILTNAIKHTPLNGNIKIEASQSDSKAFNKIMITDSGEGIPPDKIHLVFRKFGQIVSKKSGGIRSTGLGLTFCKIAVEAHGGTIDVVSHVGQGTTFWFTLPVARVEVADKQIIDSLTPDVAFELMPEEKEKLKSYCEKLKEFMVYEYSSVKEIIDRIDLNENPNIQKWKGKVYQAICSGNEEKYNELINI